MRSHTRDRKLGCLPLKDLYKDRGSWPEPSRDVSGQYFITGKLPMSVCALFAW